MKFTKLIYTVIALLAISVTGCRTPKDIAYFQDLSNGSTAELARPSNIVARPGDRISVMVTSKDQALADIFNAPVPQKRLGATGDTSLGSSSSSSNSTLPSYFVSDRGYVEIPTLGEIHVSGLTREQIAQTVRDLIKQRDLIKDPTVYVEFLTNSVSVLGAVRNPGIITFDKQYMTLVEAIASAGDLTIDGKRDNVLVVRLENGKRKAYRVDLTDADALYKSPVYYMQQDDWVYVEPNDMAKRQATAQGNTSLTPSFWLSLASFAVTIAVLIIK